MLVLALIAAGFAVQSVQRLHNEESSTHVESLLATPLSRTRWMASHLAVALGGSALILAGAGLGAGIPYAIEVGDGHQVLALVGAALVHVPAVWVLAGVAAALFGLVPRATSVAWAVLAICFVIGLLGEVLELPDWGIELSPFQHTPQLPAASLAIAPIAILLVADAALIAVGIASFDRRDLT